MICKICGNKEKNKIFNVKEMMFGLNESFKYFECGNCGCLQLITIPFDMARYYPEDYYSMTLVKDNVVKVFLKKQRDKYAIFGRGFLGRLLYKRFPPVNIERFAKLRKIGITVTEDWNILDVGSGIGASFLLPLKRLGFKNLFGVDPFLSVEVNDKGLNIFKKNVVDLEDKEKFDCITMFHSFEHMEKQKEVLKKVYDLLIPQGVCVIAIPVKSEYIWNKYKTNWVQIDAPRHFFLHTIKSLNLMAEGTGFKLIYHYFDSTEFQFWASEQYKKGIPLTGRKSFAVNPSESIFSKEDIQRFKEKAKKLNSIEQGDQAVFYFVKL